MRRRAVFPRWWEASYGDRVSDAKPTGWSRFLTEMTRRPGWSVARLARESGLNRSSIFRWIKGEPGLTLHSVHRIARALDVEPSVAMLAAAETLGPPRLDDDPEMRSIMESDLPQAKKDAIIAIVRARRARDLDDTQKMIDLAAGES